MNPIARAFELYTSRGPDGADEAMGILHQVLNDDPDDVDALCLAGRIQYDAGHFAFTETLLQRALKNKVDNNSAWIELGRARRMMQDPAGAARCFVNALRTSGDRFVSYQNMMVVSNSLGYPEKTLELAPMARFLCDSDDDAMDLNGNVAIACLMLRKWAQGWANYDGMLKPKLLRGRIDYTHNGKPVPVWKGEPGGEVIVYGEQGIGDEIMFASMIPDMIKGGTTPIIHCDRRLEGLFKRSFDCPVYGGRGKGGPNEWLEKHDPKAAIAIGSLGQFYRRKEEDFPRVAYLKADPEKRAMVRALLDQWKGKKIGIAWTAGTRKTQTNERSLTLDDLKPLLDMPGITWVSLEYKGGKPADDRIKHLPFLTQSQDYDETAALVAELDGVVCPTTSVAHLAGALGTSCHVMVNKTPTWHWCKTGDSPWHPIKSYRRTSDHWNLVVQQVKLALEMEAISQ